MSGLSYVLDGEGLARVALGDPGMKARLKDARRSGIRVVTSAMTVVETCHGKIRQPVWDGAMSGVVVEPVPQSVAEEAMRLLRSTGLHGDQYAIAAVLAVIAMPQLACASSGVATLAWASCVVTGVSPLAWASARAGDAPPMPNSPLTGSVRTLTRSRRPPGRGHAAAATAPPPRRRGRSPCRLD